MDMANICVWAPHCRLVELESGGRIVHSASTARALSLTLGLHGSRRVYMAHQDGWITPAFFGMTRGGSNLHWDRA